ncbi:iron-sulfur cluster repair protein YtfE [Methylophaga nitratireducenticrescens]|uniref:Nitric oxide-dependent regulator DnrN or NorA n=1 Tax=Methylophaga nitratireducenticrescens TaxID=754476 RepID=I1XEW0_METNJ|nr:iron-sulfur cluster repair protein YtfE [Methylophaga nitratireducenticrescens]AFI82929.1 iron-sulfur cluster repair di-iron protein [Methylophaga nitratireducenticrescens]AUZ83116.1 iron-sulfur cluster repair di-iron protein [Methylophaga nitratireducenticrescens]
MTTSTQSLLQTSLGEIATQLAGATRVFRQYKLDFCCGGGISLEEALQRKQLDAEPVLKQLEALKDESPEQDWTTRPIPELVNYIYNHFHLVHREQLPELRRMARRVETVHGDKSDCPLGLADQLEILENELESHMQKEESILFPMLQQGAGAHAGGPIQVMMHEHNDHGEALQRLVELTNDMTPPADACNTWRALYLGLDQLRNDLMEHIHLENNVLFRRALAA